MLKDIFKKKKKNDNLIDKILNNFADGYVDIKAYKVKDGEKKLVYHDTGDNTVTNWMRQVLLQLLAGYPLMKNGKTYEGTHNANNNSDASLLSSEQFYTSSTFTALNPLAGDGLTVGSDYKYALFPTKVLLGTGVEYSSWEELETANESTNASWYQEQLNNYTVSSTNVFDNYCTVNGVTGSMVTSNKAYSASLADATSSSSAYNFSSAYTGELSPAVSVNDPDSSSLSTLPSDMANRVGVVGAVKTLLTGSTDAGTYLMPTISDSGRLLHSQYRGVGKPCFIYFKRGDSADWNKPAAEVYINSDGPDYLNRITFTVTLPSQSEGEYYPYNGYLLKQIGLFNDAYIHSAPDNAPSSFKNAMPYGTMLAVKNITPFTKTADGEIKLTWSLTI